jgi:hypothetical protein
VGATLAYPEYWQHSTTYTDCLLQKCQNFRIATFSHGLRGSLIYKNMNKNKIELLETVVTCIQSPFPIPIAPIPHSTSLCSRDPNAKAKAGYIVYKIVSFIRAADLIDSKLS